MNVYTQNDNGNVLITTRFKHAQSPVNSRHQWQYLYILWWSFALHV